MSDQGGQFGFEYEQANMCFTGEVKTPFATGETIDSMKAMLADAKPATVLGVADAWKHLHDHLVGGGDSVKGGFDKAVKHILEHWEGESADEFAKKAQKISRQIADCAKYASHTSIAMRNAGERLNDIKPKVDAIEVPGDVDSALNAIGDGLTRDDTKWRGEIQGNEGAQRALDNHHDDLSAGREEQLKTAALMETLALTYSSQARTMGSWDKRKPNRDTEHEYPGDPGGVVPVPVIVTPDVSGPSAAAPGRGSTATPAVGSGTPKTISPNASQVVPATGTRLDSVSGGTTTAPGNGGTPVSSGGGRSVPTGVPTAGPTGGVPGGPGLVGRASGNRGMPAGGASATGAGSTVGRGGGGAAPGGRAAGGSGGRGPLARQRGGTADTPKAASAADRQGGQGLHSSRGGTQAGQRGAHGGGAMRGGGAAGNRRRDERESEGQRPDYLVEDEETWMPRRRNVAPPTID
ncbi:hypothetical protein E4198_01035 [Streptomyces sp. RKND-216]|uniref:hypothetical protein n=1 Tax=Streptomyces sp. RKND-216 TaxID=2562581 RepID=UPI00109DE827|nr:hypothetical protein [Streptomyces sp. RKND-216]THA23510.1 hypothetical protein E4198_01035 [Streptomyces sp. RKND-216]